MARALFTMGYALPLYLPVFVFSLMFPNVDGFARSSVVTFLAHLVLNFNFPTGKHNSCLLLHCKCIYLKYHGTASETVIKIIHTVQVYVGGK